MGLSKTDLITLHSFLSHLTITKIFHIIRSKSTNYQHAPKKSFFGSRSKRNSAYDLRTHTALLNCNYYLHFYCSKLNKAGKKEEKEKVCTEDETEKHGKERAINGLEVILRVRKIVLKPKRQ